jgi:hypothetical protein
MENAIAERLIEEHEAGSGRTRDQELVRYVGRHGVVTIEQVMKAMGVGRTAAYRRVAACAEAGLLERLDLLRSEPSVLRATREGLRYAGLGLPFALVSPSAVVHSLRCASAAQFVGEHFGHERILTEREIAFAEKIEERPIASAEITDHPDGYPRMHRADLVAFADSGTIAFEIELTPRPRAALKASSALGAMRDASRKSTISARPVLPTARFSGRSKRPAPKARSPSIRGCLVADGTEARHLDSPHRAG